MTHVTRIAVISDTHGILPIFVKKELNRLSPAHILHAGDICNIRILDDLRRIAPVSWVRGNMDGQKTGAATAVADIDGLLFYLLHNLYDIDIDPGAAGIAAVIHGHLHVPSVDWQNDILYLNPGSCVHPRGDHVPSFAVIEIRHNRLFPEIVYDR